MNITQEQRNILVKKALEKCSIETLKEMMKSKQPGDFEYIEASNSLQQKLITEYYNNFINSL
jgi:hypothetical protein